MTTVITTQESDVDVVDNNCRLPSPEVEPAVWKTFLSVVSQIDTFNGIGKDEKVKVLHLLFNAYMLSLGNAILPNWIKVMIDRYIVQVMTILLCAYVK